MNLFQDISYNKSFSQLAKESMFTFNLYRGRVDWKKLEELDVDRVVRDQDVELLNVYLNSVTNCNLESEYDVKILDPNFIKLFRLAQLLIDFLLHCKRYLEHCIKVAHENLQASNKELEVLRKQLQARKAEAKQLKKKVKEVKQQLLLSPRVTGPTFECSLCGKVFMSETFLHGHHSRRHQPHPYSLVLRSFNTQHSPHIKIVAQENDEKAQKVEEIASVKKKYQEEIEDLKTLFFAEIEKLKSNENTTKLQPEIKTQSPKEEKYVSESESKQNQALDCPKTRAAQQLTDNKTEGSKTNEDQHQQKDINQSPLQVKDKGPDLRDEPVDDSELDKKEKAEEGWIRRLEEREGVWRARLSAVDQQHKKQMQQLQDKLSSTQLQGQEIKKDLEHRLEEVLAKFEQSQKLLEDKSKEPSNDIKHKGDTKKHMNKEKSQIPSQIRHSYEETIHTDAPRQPPPFQKRKAFVSQKTKTIEESFENSENKDHAENLVQVLNQDDDESDLENVSSLTQNSSRERVDRNELMEKRTPPIIEVTGKSSEVLSKSKNKENIITKLLEEEKLRNLADNKRGSGDGHLFMADEESSFSESVTETESESEGNGEEGKIARRESESPNEQLLGDESDLAQQSLQSMEALLTANPGILQQLRSDLEQLVVRRLQNLGLDPSWPGLPPATYRDKMATLSHQRNITAKSHAVYFTLRDKLNADADAAVRSRGSQPRSAADSLLKRLRSKAAQVINAARFTRRFGSTKNQDSLPNPNLSQLSRTRPLASSSPQLSVDPVDTNVAKNSSVTTKVQSNTGESFSLSSSTCEDDEWEGEGRRGETGTTATSPHSLAPTSYKSALRHAVSSSTLAKKKVLFVDQAVTEVKRSQSENAIIAEEKASYTSTPTGNVSVASLVQEIQQQLSVRSGRPSFSVDLMTHPDPVGKDSSEIPLSQILPLTKSGRELLESPSKISNNPPKTIPSTSLLEGKSPGAFEPLSQILQKVPTSKPSSLASFEKKPDLLESSSGQLRPPKSSPAPSVSSIGSSLLDLSGSPRTPRRPLHGTLEWDLQDLEDNMKD